MRRFGLICFAALAVALGLSSCLEDNGNVWTDEDVVTRSVKEVVDGVSVLENGLFSMVYPKNWDCEFSSEDSMGVEDIRLRGSGLSITINIMPFNFTMGKKMDEIMRQEFFEGGSLQKKRVTIDGIEGIVYAGEDNDIRMCFFRNGNKTVGILINYHIDTDAEFKLEEYLTWKAGSNEQTSWIEEAKGLSDAITRSLQNDGLQHAFVKLIPEEFLFVFRSESFDGYFSREEAEEKLAKIVGVFSAVKSCAEHGFTFLVENVDEKGNMIGSHSFTPEDYNEWLE